MSATLAETVALLWPKPLDEPAELDDGSLRLSAVVERLATLRRGRGAAARWRRCSTGSMRAGAIALLKMATGALRVGVSARLAKTALAQAFDLDVDAVEEVWHGARSRPMPPCSPGPRGAARSRPPPTRRCSARSCWRIRSRTRASTWPTMPPNGNGTASACRSSGVGGETRLYSRAGDDVTRSFPEVAAAFREVGRARRRTAGDAASAQGGGRGGGRGGELQRAAAAAGAQDRVGQDAGRLSGVRPPLRHAVRRRGGSARRWPGSERRARLEAFVAAARPRAVRPVGADRGGRLRRARGDPRRRARRGDRGRDAQAPRQPLCRAGGASACGTNGSAIR